MATVTNNEHHPDGGLAVPYATRRQLRKEHGPAAAAVIDVLAFHYTADGVEMKHADVATESGMTVISVRRAIEKLCETGWLKRVHQVHGDRQIVNLYEIPASAVPDRHEHPGDHIEQAPYLHKTYTDKNQVLHYPEENLNREELLGGDPTGSLPDLVIEVSEESSVDSEVVVEEKPVRSPKADRNPLGGVRGARCTRRPNIFTRSASWSDEIAEITSAFRTRVEESTGRPVLDRRLPGWEKSIRVMLTEKRKLTEILAVIDVVSDGGFLKDSAGPAKITNLKQIRDDFDQFLAEARSGLPGTTSIADVVKSENELQDLRRRLENHR